MRTALIVLVTASALAAAPATAAPPRVMPPSPDALKASASKIPPIRIAYRDEWVMNPSVESRNLLDLQRLCNESRVKLGAPAAPVPELAAIQDHMTARSDVFIHQDQYAQHGVKVQYEVISSGNPPDCRIERRQSNFASIRDGKRIYTHDPWNGANKRVDPLQHPLQGNYILPDAMARLTGARRRHAGEKCALNEKGEQFPATDSRLALNDYICIWTRIPGLRLAGGTVALEESNFPAYVIHYTGTTAPQPAAEGVLSAIDDLRVRRAVLVEVGKPINPNVFQIPVP